MTRHNQDIQPHGDSWLDLPDTDDMDFDQLVEHSEQMKALEEGWVNRNLEAAKGASVVEMISPSLIRWKRPFEVPAGNGFVVTGLLKGW